MNDAAFATCFGQLLEFSIHEILWQRQIYPPSTFEVRQIYGVQTRRCKHSSVTDYIRAISKDVQAWVKQGAVLRVVVVLYDSISAISEGEPPAQEHFAFHIRQNAQENKQSVEKTAQPISEKEKRMLEDLFRSFLLKFGVPKTPPSSSNPSKTVLTSQHTLTWKVLIETPSQAFVDPPNSVRVVTHHDVAAQQDQPLTSTGPVVAPQEWLPTLGSSLSSKSRVVYHRDQTKLLNGTAVLIEHASLLHDSP